MPWLQTQGLTLKGAPAPVKQLDAAALEHAFLAIKLTYEYVVKPSLSVSYRSHAVSTEQYKEQTKSTHGSRHRT